MTDPFVLITAGALGLILGSFLNVCIVRLPEEESVLTPRSKCPRCGRMVVWYDNIPVLSWLVLKAQCRGCGTRISVQYPAVELAVSAMFVAAVWRYGLSVTALSAAIFGFILLGIAVTDARHFLIPDEYTWGGLGLGLVLSLAGGLSGFTMALVGAGTGFGLLYLVAWAGEKAFKQEAMGGGDIKMMAMVGAFVGWTGVLLTLFGGALLGVLIFIPLTLGKEKRLVPFGVFLAGAAAITFVYGPAIIDWYIRTLMAA
ncbi:MAG: prepilin peptidase [Gemmatimonadetes bacterium]|nr:prepilin peptidase [Gemmatimonadota bacterium]